jgi:hypothetical protein
MVAHVKRNDSLLVVLRNGDREIERKIAPSPDTAVGIAVMMQATGRRFAGRRRPQGTFAEIEAQHLVRCQLRRASHVDFTGLGTRPAFARSGLDKLPLEFSQATTGSEQFCSDAA